MANKNTSPPVGTWTAFVYFGIGSEIREGIEKCQLVYYFKTSKVCNCDLESHFKLVWTVVGILKT